MKKIILGSTGIEVTELCFGALPIGPLQKNLPLDEASEVIAHALCSGINFIDTAQVYKTYPQIRKAMDLSGVRPVIASKSPASSYEGMEADIKNALVELRLDFIDIFLLHAARCDTAVFEQRSGALRCLMDYKEKGLIKALGISTHDVAVTDAAADKKEIDIVFPILNKTGMGLLSGDRAAMEAAVNRCFDNGKGVYLMKALAGGNLIKDYDQAMRYARGFSRGLAPIAVGMISKREVDINTGYFNGEDVGDMLEEMKMAGAKRFYIPKAVCKGCGACVDACHNGAIDMIDGAAEINDKCLTCGYCVRECPQFAIRML